MPTNYSNIAAVFPKMTGALDVRHGDITGDITGVLPGLSGDIQVEHIAIDIHIDIAAEFPKLSANIQLERPNKIFLSAVLPRLSARSSVRLRHRVEQLQGQIRASGNGAFVFYGPPNRVVEWTITQGSGVLIPGLSLTDANGQATTRYKSNGYTGQLTVQAKYGR